MHFFFPGNSDYATSPSIRDNQDAIASATGTTTHGTWDPTARAKINQWYMNQKPTTHKLYLPTKPANATKLRQAIKETIWYESKPVYIRVDLTNSRWFYHHNRWVGGKEQHTPHATLALGYSDSGATIRVADPLHGNPGHYDNCVDPAPYTVPYGCISTRSVTQYFSAMDTSMPNASPVWW